MARPQHPQFPGAVYHITSRGNDRQFIYCDEIGKEWPWDQIEGGIYLGDTQFIQEKAALCGPPALDPSLFSISIYD